LADDEPNVRRNLARLLLSHGFEVLTAEDGEAALALLATTSVDVLLADATMSGITAPELVERVKQVRADVEVIVMASLPEASLAASAVQAGAYDFVTKPFVVEDAIPLVVERAVERRALVQRGRSLEERLEQHEALGEIIGRSGGLHDAYRLALAAAKSSSPVLLVGESGTGKELFARAIHGRSARSDRGLYVLDCAALPDSLVELELFGAEEGALAGEPERLGLIEIADHATLFIDAVGELSPPAQAKLAQVLARGEALRMGGERPRVVHTRVLASTSVDLKERIAAGRFREDLFYRLSVLSIYLPPLRRRRDDIALLAYHFLRRYARRTGREIKRISVEALRRLRELPWPGNVRELESAIEHAVIMARGEAIMPLDLPFSSGRDGEGSQHGSGAPALAAGVSDLPYPDAKERVLDAFDLAYIDSVMDQSGGNISEAARRAGMDRSNFRRLLRKVRGKDHPSATDERAGGGGESPPARGRKRHGRG
jgi:DNA-binding NtrC family response regulator